MIEYPDYGEWTIEGREWVDNWEYRNIDTYPPADASVKEIMEFIKDAKEAEKAIIHDLVADGMSEEEAWVESCQYPLKDETPIDVIRGFMGYMHSLQESANNGVVI